MNLSNINYIFFDVDGLLINSEMLSWFSFKQACALYNLSIDKDVYLNTIGTSWESTFETLIKVYGTKYPYDLIYRDYQIIYQNREREITTADFLKEGVIDILNYCQESNITAVAVSSTGRILLNQRLERFGLAPYFSAIISCDSVTSPKPAPDVYLYTLNIVGCTQEECIVIEDSNHGVDAALSANIPVIQVPDIVAPLEHFKYNTLYHKLTSLNEVMIELKSAKDTDEVETGTSTHVLKQNTRPI
ncbi:HAD family phosphatase [Pseudoalteromonas sp. MMG022]|uniref:HAD family hydrolase n=1 Tax=Pseudoalteromonas sp. MMG022 TaxID=2909978 RepID=UPI001F186669|nr:HAD family phosphatase [Pseudoalteromonas sp. MMG022]MCF6437775.1 HAD family phosphatase [Pseudoalteromonas sp. MMG022]